MFGSYLEGIETDFNFPVVHERLASFGSYLEGIETTRTPQNIYTLTKEFGSYLEGIETLHPNRSAMAKMICLDRTLKGLKHAKSSDGRPGDHGFGSYLEGIETSPSASPRRNPPSLDRTLKGLKLISYVVQYSCQLSLDRTLKGLKL